MAPVDRRVTAFSFRRQHLDGSARSAVEVLGDVPGVYAAMPSGPLSIRVRARGVRPGDVATLETDRVALRMRAMRTSAFLVPRSHARLVGAATAVPEQRFAWLARAAGVDAGGLAEARAAVTAAAATPLTPAEIRQRLRGMPEPPSWAEGERLRPVLSLLTAVGDVVAVGGPSLSSNAVRYVDRRAWLEDDPAPPVDAAEARAWLAGAYLRAFGPARVDDLAWWAGWPKREAAAAVAAHDTVVVGDGLRLLAADVPAFEAAVPLPDAVTLVPRWDSWTMGYPLDGRGRFLDRAVHDRVFDGDGNGLAMVLRGGRAIGAWAHRGERGTMAADLDLFEPVTSSKGEAIEDELRAIAAFLGYRGLTVRDVATVIPDRRRQRRPLEG
jgi:hypothetical protein